MSSTQCLPTFEGAHQGKHLHGGDLMTSPSRPRSGKLRALTGATVLTAGIIAAIPAAAQAITIPVACADGENALVRAVILANSTSAADTLVLAGGCTYRLTNP